ncbi:MAG: hypothetical protein E7143_01875 [Rikenellaceae bacterium]|nr:hypothetical protein [Rikenellaceae bacterium]
MRRLIYLLFGALGFTACSESMMCEYGTPTAHFTVKGRVTDADGKPIKGIVISSKDVYGLDAVTGEDGHFATQKIEAIGIHGTLLFTDIDGTENGGEFETQTVDLDALPETKVAKGDGHWYMGEYEVTADVKLKAK